MDTLRLAAMILCSVLAVGCEKAIITGEEDGTTQGSGGTSGNKDVIDADTSNIEYLTVAEAQDATVGEVICVRGYIVASCTRAMSNADFKPPFEGSTAIILADEPVDTVNFQYATDDDLFPVCLTDYKDVRAALNLEDNPELWNKLIFIIGSKARYMSCPGLKKVLYYQVVD